MQIGDRVVITKRIGYSMFRPMAVKGDRGVIRYITNSFIGVYLPDRGYGVDLDPGEFKVVEPSETVNRPTRT